MIYFFYITFYISIFHKCCGVTVEKAGPASVESTNPTVAEKQAFLQLFGNGDPDEAASCGQLIESRGFQYERYYVTTEDGYILQNFRIINPYAREARNTLKPVLLVHPILASCASWLFNSPASLGFLLANLGYDVWLINARGTSYSTNHTHLDPEGNSFYPVFWDYSFYEIGIYDVTSTVEHIKNETGFEKITVVAYSQGSIQMITQMSLMPWFQDNYDIVILAAPAGFVGEYGFFASIPNKPAQEFFSSSNGPYPSNSAFFYSSLSALCVNQLASPICVTFFGNLGFDRNQFNASRLSVYISLRDRSSKKNLLHIFQSVERDHLSFFDYGEVKNYALYGSAEPPEFPYYNINPNKLIFMSGLNDQVIDQRNVQKFRNSLCDRVDTDHIIQDPYWKHSFLAANEAYAYFGSVVADLIRERGDSTECRLNLSGN
uniref:Lipase n=1 Tax=Tetranychus urticae TaxID=32264 RepID=T1JVK7_TETUR